MQLFISHFPLIVVIYDMESHICNTCKQAKPPDQFYRNIRSKDGIDHRCKACETARKTKWSQDNKEKCAAQARAWRLANPSSNKQIWQRAGKKTRDKLINFTREIRSKNPCCICKEPRINCLEFHHLNPDSKTRAVASCKSMKQLLDEIVKCVVVCSNCHALYHAGDVKLPDDVQTLTI